MHGCFDELMDLFIAAKVDHGDRVILAGDLVDRGPNSLEVVRYAKTCGIEAVLGNHDEKHVRLRRHLKKRDAQPGYKVPMRPFTPSRQAQHDLLSDDDVAWIASLPVFLRFKDGEKDWLVVHGGMLAERPVEEQDPKIVIRCRWVEAETGYSISKSDPTVVPAGAVFWTERWKGPESVVYGHNVFPDRKPRYDRHGDVTCVGIDTGCCFGGTLTAAVFTGTGMPELVSVPAKKEHAVYGPARD